MKNRMLLWLRIVRPQTLFASLVPVLVGVLSVHRSGTAVVATHPTLTAVLTALCALSLQILSNLINDWYDFKRGTDKAGRAGFRRALAEGEVTERQMLIAIGIDLSIAVLTGLYLVWEGGLPILAIGLSAILFAYLYTATSHSLSYLGIADIFVLLYYGLIASAGTAYLLTGSFVPMAFHAGAVCGLISMGVLMINNLRDIEDDRAAGKRTLPVRFGKRGGEIVMLAEVLLMPVAAWMAFGFSPSVFIVLPALALYVCVLHASGPLYNRCLLATGLLNFLYLILCLI